MDKTVVGLMETSRAAQAAVDDLLSECGCTREQIGVMARGEEKKAGALPHAHEGEAGRGAAKGAAGGALVGGVLGLVAGFTAIAIPGLGPIIAAGPIGAAFAGMGIGALAGGVIGALRHLGIPEHEAHYYAEGVKRGGTLITVQAPDDKAAACAARALSHHGAVDIDQRADEWRKAGWKGRVDEHDAAPVAAAESDREAARKREEAAQRMEKAAPVEGAAPLRAEELRAARAPAPAATQGSARVYTRVTETPAVIVREERIEVRGEPQTRMQRGAQDRRIPGGSNTGQYRGPERRARNERRAMR